MSFIEKKDNMFNLFFIWIIFWTAKLFKNWNGAITNSSSKKQLPNKFLEQKSTLAEDKLIDEGMKTKYLSLPYINDKSEIISRNHKKLVKQYYPKINLRVAFKSPAQLDDHFPFKDQVIDPNKQSNVDH